MVFVCFCLLDQFQDSRIHIKLKFICQGLPDLGLQVALQVALLNPNHVLFSTTHFCILWPELSNIDIQLNISQCIQLVPLPKSSKLYAFWHDMHCELHIWQPRSILFWTMSMHCEIILAGYSLWAYAFWDVQLYVLVYNLQPCFSSGSTHSRSRPSAEIRETRERNESKIFKGYGELVWRDCFTFPDCKNGSQRRIYG